MNIKRIIALAAVMTVVGTSCVFGKTMEFTIDSNKLLISDGVISETVMEAEPYILNDRTMVPVRVISETFGKEVSWDGDTKTVTIKSSDKEIKLVIGSTEAVVNGAVVSLDAAPQISGDRTMIPLRFVTETLGFDVTYVDATRQVMITDEKPAVVIGNKKISADIIKLYCVGDEDEEGTVRNNVESFLNETQMAYLMACAAEINGVTLDEEEKDQIKTISQLMGGENILAGFCADFIANYTLADKYYNQKMTFTDEEIDKYYRENYADAKHILFATVNLETGEELPEDEREAARIKAEGVLEEIRNGGNFDEYMVQYTEDTGLESNPDGYVFTKGEMITEFEDAVYSLKEDTLCDVLVESAYGYHIIKRLPLPDTNEEIKQNVKTKLSSLKYPELFTDVLGNVAISNVKSLDEIVALILN